MVEAPGHETSVLGIRLTVAGAYALFGRPMQELTGLTVDLQDLLGSAAAELQDRCWAESSPRGRFNRAAEWIEARLRRGIRADPAVAWAVDQIRRCGGAVSISRLREQAGLSSNRIASAFREQVGVTAKQYARIVRFRLVLDRLHAGTVSLADAAHEPWIIAAPGSSDCARLVAAACTAAGFTPKISHEATDVAAVAARVSYGLGVSLVPRLAPVPSAYPVVRIALREPAPSRHILSCVRCGSDRQPLIARGLAALRDASQRLPREVAPPASALAWDKSGATGSLAEA
ncbi:MAG: LysR substrate-binding domain-containing protein [Dehalococcoidia bacterium]